MFAEICFRPHRTGIDVVFDFDGKRIGAHQTTFHGDEVSLACQTPACVGGIGCRPVGLAKREAVSSWGRQQDVDNFGDYHSNLLI